MPEKNIRRTQCISILLSIKRNIIATYTIYILNFKFCWRNIRIILNEDINKNTSHFLVHDNYKLITQNE